MRVFFRKMKDHTPKKGKTISRKERIQNRRDVKGILGVTGKENGKPSAMQQVWRMIVQSGGQSGRKTEGKKSMKQCKLVNY